MEKLEQTYQRYVNYCLSVGIDKFPSFDRWMSLRGGSSTSVTYRDAANAARDAATGVRESSHVLIHRAKLGHGVSSLVMNAVWG
jgi:hypothetical protein